MKQPAVLSALLILLIAGLALAQEGPAPLRADARYARVHSSWSATVVDSVRVMGPGATYSGDFQQMVILPGWNGWSGVDLTAGQAGDFAQVWLQLEELDACQQNTTPQLAFVDESYTASSWAYGPGGAAVNPLVGIRNLAVSPVMDWDGDYAGGLLEFDVFRHQPIGPGSPGLFYVWYLRSAAEGQDIGQAEWRSRDFHYYGGPDALRHREVVTDLLVPGCAEVQVALGVVDLGDVWGWDGTDSTPGPYFDNVAVTAFQCGGPVLAALDVHLAQDSFPASGVIDYDHPAVNVVRYDMARNVSAPAHMLNDPGDSIVVDARPLGAGTLQVRLHYLVQPNLLFNPTPRPTTGWLLPSEVIIPDRRYAFDLDGTVELFPGDVVHYYIEADDGAGTSTLPSDLAGWDDFSLTSRWDPDFTMRALPTLRSQLPGDQPQILLWYDAGPGGEDEWITALSNLGLQLGYDFDVYRTHGPSSGVGNGLGGRATPFVLEGYQTIVYAGGDLDCFTLSNGDYPALDAGDDLGLLDAWLQQGQKRLLLMGSRLASDLARTTEGLVFLTGQTGCTLVAPDLRTEIGGQDSPTVQAITSSWIFYEADDQWSIRGACPEAGRFDAVQVMGPAPEYLRLAEFTTPACAGGAYSLSAATLHEEPYPLDSKVTYLPYSFPSILTGGCGAKIADPAAARTKLLYSILLYFGQIGGDPIPSPDLTRSTATCAAAQQVSIMAAPRLDGTRLDHAYVAGGGTTDATITLTLINDAVTPAPIPFYPAEDMWLQTTLGGLAVCPAGAIADDPTDEYGRTTFSGPVHGGGHTDPAIERTQVYISGSPLTQPPLDIQFNSPDLDGNLMVDLLDVADFAAAYFPTPYSYAADLNWDQERNLSDVSLLKRHFATSAAPPPEIPPASGVLGVYFDPEGTQTVADWDPEMVERHAYLILKGVTAPISGFECRVELEGPAFVLGWDLQVPSPGGLNLGEGTDSAWGDFNVGLPAPLATGADVVLIDLRLIYSLPPGDPSPVAIYVKPPATSSWSGLDAPAYADAATRTMVPLGISSGDFDLPVAWINPDFDCNVNGIFDRSETTKTSRFCITGTSTGHPWSWGIRAPGGGGFSYIVTDQPALPVGADAAAFVRAFVDAINAPLCESIHAEARPAPLEMCFDITVPGDQGFEFGVGDAGQDPVCWISAAWPCMFNPTVNQVSVTGVPEIREFDVRSYPNPFNPAAQVAYRMPREGRLVIRVFDLKGRLVRTLLDATVPAGTGEVTWDGADDLGGKAASGVYFYQAEAQGEIKTGKFALIR